MRLSVQFGTFDPKIVAWWDSFDNFPHIIKFLGRNYEWVTYDKDLTGNVDMIINYSELQSYDPNFSVACPLWTDMFKEDTGGCECGARFTSFSWDHMKFCSKWKPWSQI